MFYRDSAYRFDGYVAAVKAKLGDLEAALAGEFVDWTSSDPEGSAGDAGADRGARRNVARVMQAEHHA